MKILIEDHTADIILSVEAFSLEEIVLGLVEGLSELYWGKKLHTLCDDNNKFELMVSGDGPNMTFAVSSLLSEFLYLFELRKIVLCNFKDLKYSRQNNMVYVSILGEFAEVNEVPEGADIKAVSFSMKWQASVILDL